MWNGDWKLVQLDQERREDMKREAARARRIREVLADDGWVRLYGPLLARVGVGLVTWGVQLQRRYGRWETALHDMGELRPLPLAMKEKTP